MKKLLLIPTLIIIVSLFAACSELDSMDTQPTTNNPVVTEPVTTEPVTTEPVTTEPVITAPTSATLSRLQLLLTDAPTDEATALMVNFGELQLIGGTTDDSEDEAGVKILSDDGGSFDILALQNGKTALLADLKIPDGTYSQLRIIIEDATITIDGEDKPVTIPGGTKSGLKVNINPPLVVADGKASEIILDFNARRVTETGNGRFQLAPTAIRATSESGTLTGTIVDLDGNPLENVQIAVSDLNNNAITEAATDEDGEFKIISLNEGQYSVEVSSEGYESQSISDVVISNGEKTKLSSKGDIVLVATGN